MKKLFRQVFLLMFCLLTILPSTISTANASMVNQDGGMESNISTINGNYMIKPPVGSSTIITRNNLIKVTVYLGMNNNEQDFPRRADGSIDPAKVNINKMAKFGYSIYISPVAQTYKGPALANVTTDKFDAIKNYINGSNSSPSYTFGGNYYRISQSNGNLIVNPSFPKFDTGGANYDISSVKSYFNKGENAWLMIMQVASKYGTGSGMTEKIQSLLNKINFDFKDESGNPITITDLQINPSESNKFYVVPVAVLVEPAFYYNEDPTNLARSSAPNQNFAMTATDCVLTALSAGKGDYVSKVDFISTSKPYARLWHCKACDRSWQSRFVTFEFKRCAKSRYYKEMYEEMLDFEYAKTFDCITRDDSRLESKNWYPFCIASAPKSVAKSITPDKDWFNGFVLKPTSLSMFDRYNFGNITRYGGYGVFFIGDKGTPVKPVMEVRVIDSTITPIIGVEVDAGMVPQQDTAKMDENYNILSATQTDAFKEILLRWVQNAKNLIHNQPFTGVQNQQIISTENFIPVVFSDMKLGQEDISGKSSDLVNQMLGHADVKIQSGNEKDMVYLYTDKLTEIYERIVEKVKNNQDPSALIAEYQRIANSLEAEYQNYMNQPGVDTNLSQIVLADGTVIEVGEDINGVMTEIGWADTFILLGENPSITDPHNPDVILDIENPPKVNIVIPVKKTQKVGGLGIGVSGDIKEDELTKGLAFDFSRGGITSETIPATSCPGGRLVWDDGYDCNKEGCTSCPHGAGYEWVNCGHDPDIPNKKSFTIQKSYITTKCYWDIAMLENVHKLSILRTPGALTDDGVNFVFNEKNDYVTDQVNNVYSILVKYWFVGHRSANLSESEFVKLAAYMNETNYNKGFIGWIKPYYNAFFGGDYPSLYSNQSGKFGKNDYIAKTVLSTPKIDIGGTLTACSGKSKYYDNVGNYGVINHPTDGAFVTSSTVTVEPTIIGTNKENPKVNFQTIYTGNAIRVPDNLATECSYHVKLPSNTYEFNPAFKMKYYKDNKNSSKDDVWILAYGDRKFNGTDYFKVTLTNPILDVTSQWSRDLEDRGLADPVVKSGSTIRAKSDGSIVTIDAWYNIQDPAFVGKKGSAEYNAAQQLADKIAKEYNKAAQDIIDNFVNNGASFYTNMYMAADANTVHKPIDPANFQNLREKTEFKYYAYNVNPKTYTAANIISEAYYVDFNSQQDYAPTARTISLDGETVSVRGEWKDEMDPNGVVDSHKRLEQLLIKNAGYNKKWYNEDYEGILVVHKRWQINFDNLSITYAQIHPQHSDNLTEMDALAQELKFKYQNNILIANGEGYGIGTEYRLPGVKLNGIDVPEGALVTRPYLYHIRGAVYDIK